MNVLDWSCEDVESWLIEKGYRMYGSSFYGVDGEVLLALTEKDLHSLNLPLPAVKKINNFIQNLSREYQREVKKNRAPQVAKQRHRNVRSASGGELSDQCSSPDSYDSDEETSDKVFPADITKLFVSFLYAVFASWITAFTMVLAHERVPDMAKYPPLPDIVLDHVPLMPEAFKLAETCGLILCLTWITILVFHKHRFVLLRRFFSIISTIFLLRSVTIYATSLSVPGTHLACEATCPPSMYDRVIRACHIVAGLGMALTGVQTCGDYMFSGHTVYLTIFSHFITEYVPRRFYLIHSASWILNLFGMFFILAAHEHYTIDVVIAFFLTSRIFLYYHMLANTDSYSRSRRIRVHFPCFSYFECNVPGKVPNEYEIPFESTFRSVKTCFSLFSAKCSGAEKEEAAHGGGGGANMKSD